MPARPEEKMGRPGQWFDHVTGVPLTGGKNGWRRVAKRSANAKRRRRDRITPP